MNSYVACADSTDNAEARGQIETPSGDTARPGKPNRHAKMGSVSAAGKDAGASGGERSELLYAEKRWFESFLLMFSLRRFPKNSVHLLCVLRFRNP